MQPQENVGGKPQHHAENAENALITLEQAPACCLILRFLRQVRNPTKKLPEYVTGKIQSPEIYKEPKHKEPTLAQNCCL